MGDTEQQSSAENGVNANQKIADFEQMHVRAQALLALIDEMTSTATTASQSALESQRQVAGANTSAQMLLAELTAASTQALAAKTQVLDAQTVIATKSDHIEGARAHADQVRGDLDRTLTAATQQATEAEGLKARTQTASDGVTALQTSVQTSKGLVDADVTAIAAARNASNASAAALKGLSDKAAIVEKSIADYEDKLVALEIEYKEQLKTITNLLPGATSAGLAHAFDDRRKTFLSPAEKWQWFFIGSVGSLVLLALSGLWHVYQGTTVITYDELGRLWLARLPVAAALVWLALHASRESALAKRLEEDYGYKAAVAASFQGFHKQMSELGTAAGPDTPLAQLCGDTLATIANPPGRIYEKHALVVAPVDGLKDATKAMLPQPH